MRGKFPLYFHLLHFVKYVLPKLQPHNNFCHHRQSPTDLLQMQNHLHKQSSHHHIQKQNVNVNILAVPFGIFFYLSKIPENKNT